jgi:hypothetical protein
MLVALRRANRTRAIEASPPFVAIALTVLQVKDAMSAHDGRADSLVAELTSVSTSTFTNTRSRAGASRNVASSGADGGSAVRTGPAIKTDTSRADDTGGSFGYRNVLRVRDRSGNSTVG